MECDELLHLLNTDWQEDEECLFAHLRSCPHCRHGIVRLSEALIAKDVLTCDQCRACFPDYYEATRPDHPLVKMSDADMTAVVIHLGRCASCCEEYEVLVELSEAEEHDLL